MNICHCPETSKDANGLNRYYRLKVLLNVAEFLYVISCQSSTRGKVKTVLTLWKAFFKGGLSFTLDTIQG